MRVAIIALSASFLGLAVPAQAGDLGGTMYDAQARPAAGVRLTIEALGRAAVSGADGKYRFEGLGAGEHEVAVALGRDAVQRIYVDIDQDADSTRNIVLLSRRVVAAARADADRGEDAGEAAQRAYEMAQDMVRESAAREPIDWRWSDHAG